MGSIQRYSLFLTVVIELNKAAIHLFLVIYLYVRMSANKLFRVRLRCAHDVETVTGHLHNGLVNYDNTTQNVAYKAVRIIVTPFE